ncbi:Unknown protein, partial [Striga hermonthica]
LGGPSTISQMRELIKTHHPHFFFLFETKKQKSFVKSIGKKLGYDDRVAIVNPMGLSGGLALFWNSSIVISQVICKDFYIAVQFSFPSHISQWGIFVYINPCRNIRTAQWNSLIQDSISWGNCWFAIGDWNDLCSNEEKSGGIPRNPNSFQAFKSFINQMNMEELKMQGHPYTWCNNREGDELIEEQLDRAFSSEEWHQLFPNAAVKNNVRSASDHSALVLDLGLPKAKKQARFHFDKRWIGKEGFEDTVKKAWQIPVSGTPFFKLKEKIKNTRIALLKWSSSFYTQNQKLIAELTSKLEQLNHDKTDDNWDSWAETKRDLNKAHLHEELFWQQKSRQRWLREGDANTRFFHTFTLQRRRHNAITRLLCSQGRVLTSQRAIEQHIADFYTKLFTSEGSMGGDSIIHLIPQTITADMNAALLKPVTEEEVKAALFNLPTDKAPGEEGMNSTFYQHFWELI